MGSFLSSDGVPACAFSLAARLRLSAAARCLYPGGLIRFFLLEEEALQKRVHTFANKACVLWKRKRMHTVAGRHPHLLAPFPPRHLPV